MCIDASYIPFSAVCIFFSFFFLASLQNLQGCPVLCLLHTCQLTICALDFRPIFIFSTRPRFPRPVPLFYSNTAFGNLHFAFSPTNNLHHCFALSFGSGAGRDATTTTTQHHIAHLRLPSTIHPPHHCYYYLLPTCYHHHYHPTHSSVGKKKKRVKRGACICQHLCSCLLAHFPAK